MAFANARFAGFNFGRFDFARFDFGKFDFAKFNTFAKSNYGAFAGRYSGELRAAALDRLDLLATIFDTAVVIPGTGIRFGAEAMLRLIPGIGDVAASALSFYLLYEASRLGVPKWLLVRMAANVVIEGAVGTVPVAGDAFDIFFRANRRNVALLRNYFAREGF